MKDADVLKEQIDYNRARAAEYDRTTGGNTPPWGWRKEVLEQIVKLGPCERILELACGTGVWTETLASMGKEVTAIDAAPEMLRIARRRVTDAHVNFQCADLFTWEPDGQYDRVFFAFWLSHVPPDLLGPFLAKVGRAIRIGGQVVVVDQHAPTEEDRVLATGDWFATRPLSDGRTFRIVKVFHDLPPIERQLSTYGFTATVHRLNDEFFILTGTRGPNPIISMHASSP